MGRVKGSSLPGPGQAYIQSVTSMTCWWFMYASVQCNTIQYREPDRQRQMHIGNVASTEKNLIAIEEEKVGRQVGRWVGR